MGPTINFTELCGAQANLQSVPIGSDMSRISYVNTNAVASPKKHML